MYQKRLVVQLSLLSFVTCLILACVHFKGKDKEAIFVDTTYKFLATSAIAYDNTMNALADLYYEGYITEDTKQQALRTAFLFWASYHAAVDLLEKYLETKAELVKKEIQTELDKMSGHLQNLEGYVDEAKNK